MKIINYILTLCMLWVSTEILCNKPKSGPISRSCPVCPDFSCPTSQTGQTGGTGATGQTGPTGPCNPATAAPFCCLNVTNTTTIQGNVRVTNIAVANQISITGNADLKDDVIVQGRTNFQNDVCMEGNLSVLDNVSVAGQAAILGTLTVDNGAIFNGFSGQSGSTGPALIETGDVVVNGSVSVEFGQTLDGNLNVNCAATFNGPLTANDGLIVNNGETIYNGGLIILSGDAIISGNLCINGNETVSGNVTASGQLTVDGNTTLNNTTIGASGTLTTNNFVIFNSGLTIASGDEIINSGSLTLNTGNLSVAGTSTFNGLVTANGGALISGGLIVNDGETISMGDLDVSTGNVLITGNLTVNGSITGGTGTLGSLTLSGDQNSLNPTGGSLVVAGGAGVSKDIWKGGSEFFAQVSATGGTPTALNYYEETCFSTPLVWGGVTTSPSESVLIRIVRLGNIVNLLIPAVTLNNPGTHSDVINSLKALPVRFRPFSTVRGPSSTIIANVPPSPTCSCTTLGITIAGASCSITSCSLTPATGPTSIVGELGEFNIDPNGIITFGLAGPLLSPQIISSVNSVQLDYNTITYSLDGCVGPSSICVPS